MNAPAAIDCPYLFLPRTPAQIAGFIQLHDGKVCAIVENYAEVFEAPPAVTDGTSVILAVEVDPEDVKVFQDGDKTKLVLWRGDKQSRTKPSDKLTLPFHSLDVARAILAASAGAGAATSSGDPVENARAAFGEYPPEVQLAAALVSVSAEEIGKLPEMSPARAQAVLNWAQATISSFAAAQPAV